MLDVMLDRPHQRSWARAAGHLLLQPLLPVLSLWEATNIGDILSPVACLLSPQGIGPVAPATWP